MERMIAFCGLDCTVCPALLATNENSDEKRQQVAEQWSKDYKAEIKASDINCDGCLSSNGKLFSHCTVCEIRSCGRGKAVKNCGFCSDYPCSKISAFFQMVPQAKTTLDEIRSRI